MLEIRHHVHTSPIFELTSNSSVHLATSLCLSDINCTVLAYVTLITHCRRRQWEFSKHWQP